LAIQLKDFNGSNHASDLQQFSSEAHAYQNEDVPLLRLFKEFDLFAMGVSVNEKSSSEFVSPFSQPKEVMRVLTHLVLEKDSLVLILRLTEPYWTTFPVAPSTSLSNQPQEATVQRVQRFIRDSLNFQQPSLFAKAALCLAACLEQLPKGFDAIFTNQAVNGGYMVPTSVCSRSSTLSAIMNGAKVLVSTDTDSRTTIEGVECGLL
jgi:hypothetical protein